MSILSNNRPPALSRRGPWYLCPAADLPALLDLLRRHPELEEWHPSDRSQMRRRELARFYHRPAGSFGKVEPAGIVIDRLTSAGHWLRLEGAAAERVRPLVDRLVVEPEPAPPAAEQLALFAQVAGGAR